MKKLEQLILPNWWAPEKERTEQRKKLNETNRKNAFVSEV